MGYFGHGIYDIGTHQRFFFVLIFVVAGIIFSCKFILLGNVEC